MTANKQRGRRLGSLDRRRWARGLGLALWLLPVGVRADSAAAEALFERGKTLMQEGKIDEACAKFEESHRIEPGGGVLINLATCHERQGRTATAWAGFKEALALAAKAGRADRESFARERIEFLEKQLPRLRIDVPAEARVAGLSLRRGEVALGEGAWGEALPVDPGKHTIQVSAPGHEGRSYEVQARAGELTTLRIAPLELRSSPVSSSPVASSGAPASSEAPSAGPVATPAPVAAGGPRRTAGYVVGGAGLLALWAGGVFGVRAVMKRQESDADCPGGACNARGWSTYEDAQRAARYANVGLAVGGRGAGGRRLAGALRAAGDRGRGEPRRDRREGSLVTHLFRFGQGDHHWTGAGRWSPMPLWKTPRPSCPELL
jgi:tetratricopeptide (TPR) repeat protein